jgi:hypothetical protein
VQQNKWLLNFMVVQVSIRARAVVLMWGVSLGNMVGGMSFSTNVSIDCVFITLGVNIMNKQYKTKGLVVTALCLATLSLPSYAWQGAGNGRQGAARTANGGAAAWNRNTGNAVVQGPNGNTAAVHGGGYHPPVPAYGYRGGAAYNNNGYSSGQVAGAAVVGAAVGAAAAKAKQPPPQTTTVIVQPPQ